MEQSIKQRIADIRRGNVPAGYKRTKLGIIPIGWQTPELNSVLSENKERNRSGRFSKEDVLSVSGEFGVTNQIDLLGRSFAGVSVKDYHVVESGNIVYTKSPLKSNPYGIIKLNKGEAGIVSTLYAVYNCQSHDIGTYLDYYFSIDRNVNSYLRPLVRKGTKNDMKINNEDALGGLIILPPEAEIKKIVEILECCDRVIALKKKLIAEKKKQKRALMQKLLNPDSGFRLPGFSGEWKMYELRDLYSFRKSLCASRAQLGVHGIAYLHYGDIHKSTKYYIDVLNEFDNLPKLNIAANCSEYMLMDGDVVFVDASEDYDGASKYIVVINPNKKPFLAGLHTIVARPQKQFLSKSFQQFCFQNWVVRHQFFHYTSGMKVFGMNIENLGKVKLSLPAIKEQQAIADILSAADREIDLLEQALAQQQQKKKSLMQLLLTGTARV